MMKVKRLEELKGGGGGNRVSGSEGHVIAGVKTSHSRRPERKEGQSLALADTKLPLQDATGNIPIHACCLTASLYINKITTVCCLNKQVSAMSGSLKQHLNTHTHQSAKRNGIPLHRFSSS